MFISHFYNKITVSLAYLIITTPAWCINVKSLFQSMCVGTILSSSIAQTEIISVNSSIAQTEIVSVNSSTAQTEIVPKNPCICFDNISTYFVEYVFAPKNSTCKESSLNKFMLNGLDTYKNGEPACSFEDFKQGHGLIYCAQNQHICAQLFLVSNYAGGVGVSTGVVNHIEGLYWSL